MLPSMQLIQKHIPIVLYCVYLCNRYILMIIIILVPVFKQESLNIVKDAMRKCNFRIKGKR